MTYKFTMYSDVYGTEVFGGYGSFKDAVAAKRRIKLRIIQLNDGIERLFGDIVQEDEMEGARELLDELGVDE